MKLLQPLYRILKLLQQIKRVDSWMLVNFYHAYIEKYRKDLLSEPRYQDSLCLNRYEQQVFSQNGEDGIIAEIFRRIGSGKRYFLEIGVGNGLENNTTFLLLQGWTGTWIDANNRAFQLIRKHFHTSIRDSKLHAILSTVTVENVGNLIEQLKLPKDITLLSIDIDRNTYWILNELLKKIQPAVIVVEYNGIFPSDIDWKVEYDPVRMWNGSSYTSASLKAYENMCKEYSYSLVGCELCGINAFFVRDDLCEDKFLRPFTSENHYQPLRDFLVHRIGPARSISDMENK